MDKIFLNIGDYLILEKSNGELYLKYKIKYNFEKNLLNKLNKKRELNK